MKSIVLYILIIAVLFLRDAAGQKPVIDLLPSDHRQINSEIATDTILDNDSIAEIAIPDSLDPGTDLQTYREVEEKLALRPDRYLPDWITRRVKNRMMLRTIILIRNMSIH
jgi:hypothetical protein